MIGIGTRLPYASSNTMAKLACVLLFAVGVCDGRKVPELPKQFSADLEITAHLVDRTKDYPPWLRKIHIKYDFDNKLARANITHGYEAGRTYIRRYDQKREYMVKAGEFAECQRSYLGEKMPLPEQIERLCEALQLYRQRHAAAAAAPPGTAGRAASSSLVSDNV